MDIIRIQDKYNKDKYYLIKIYKAGQVHINQEINGKIFYKEYKRTTKKYIKEFLNIEL